MSSTQSQCPILIVEDDKDLRNMITQILTIKGFSTTTIANKREALDYLHQTIKPNIILLDLIMPIIDDQEFQQRQQTDPDLTIMPMIVLSALNQSRATPVNACTFLKKPLDFDHLLQLVHDYCH